LAKLHVLTVLHHEHGVVAYLFFSARYLSPPTTAHASILARIVSLLQIRVTLPCPWHSSSFSGHPFFFCSDCCNIPWFLTHTCTNDPTVKEHDLVSLPTPPPLVSRGMGVFIIAMGLTTCKSSPPHKCVLLRCQIHLPYSRPPGLCL
jgi:hypothetical protein